MIANFDDPSVGAVYGRQLPRPGSSPEREDALDTFTANRGSSRIRRTATDWVIVFIISPMSMPRIRRSVWEAVRFPEDLRVFEDLGIAKGILDRGWKIVYEPETPVFHSHSHTTVGLFKRYFDIGYTLKLLKIWDVPGTRKSMLRDGWKLVKNKVRRMPDKGAGRLAGEGIRQDIAKSAGLFLGLNQSYLPLAIKRRLSGFRVFE